MNKIKYKYILEMAKGLSLSTYVLSVVLLLVLIYFFRPQTFSFLTQGFNPDMGDPDEEGYEEEGFCNEGEMEDSNGNCVPVEGFFDCVNGLDENGDEC
jgi:hypothetical protein